MSEPTLQRSPQAGSGSSAGPPGQTTKPTPPKLQRLSVQGATQKNVDNSSKAVDAANNWAVVRKSSGSDMVIVEALTTPNTPDAWKQLKWSGDTGASVAGKLNQRAFFRSESKKFRLKAELGGVTDYVNIWVLAAKLDILVKGVTPVNAAKFAGARDGTETLGPRTYQSFFGEKATGKIAVIATLSPPGVHDVVTAGWSLMRKVWCHDWSDGNKLKPGNQHGDRWNTAWTPDVSLPQNLKLTPDAGDRIYDIDAPDVEIGALDAETYNNFQQWVEWNGDICSVEAGWYYQARWQNTAAPDQTPVGKIVLNSSGAGNQPLPDKSYFHPNGPAKLP